MYIYIWTHPPPHDLPRSVSLVNTVKNPLGPYAIFCYSQWLSLDKTDPTRPTRLDAETRETKKPKKPSFLENGEGMLKKIVFLVLPRTKMVFHGKTNFSHVKRWFWSGLPQENHLFAR